MIAVVFGIGGAAVDAAEVTTIRNRDAQVGDVAAEFVVQDHGSWHLLDATPR
jgi:ribonuclease D